MYNLFVKQFVKQFGVYPLLWSLNGSLNELYLAFHKPCWKLTLTGSSAGNRRKEIKAGDGHLLSSKACFEHIFYLHLVIVVPLKAISD